ncbi:MAG: TetR/AcrR family transcriptional regulator [Chloroflexi bacterium]|nr:TetR/AcrR family transcriptional regulator [Chloroflexota bacterium]
MPKVTEAHMDARRRQILDAATACFARQGFHLTRMQDICKEARLSPGAVYRYFRSKEEIIHVMGHESEQRGMALIESLKERGDTRQALEQLATFFFRQVEKPDKLMQACMRLDIELWAEALRSPSLKEHILQAFDSHLKPFAELMRQAQRRGEVAASLDPDAIARVMVSFYVGVVLQKMLEGDVNVPAYGDVVKAMMCGEFWRGGRERRIVKRRPSAKRRSVQPRPRHRTRAV